jgi:hypothetical protein
LNRITIWPGLVTTALSAGAEETKWTCAKAGAAQSEAARIASAGTDLGVIAKFQLMLALPA